MTTISERTKFPQVLLIDDSRGDAILIRLAFRWAKVPSNISVAATAEIGLKILHRQGAYDATPFPDLILLDLNLPLMQGGEFLTLVKADSVLRLIPVIVMSTSDAESDLRATYGTYANGFITKPSTPADCERVISAIENYWFEVVQTPEVQQPASPEPQDRETVPTT